MATIEKQRAGFKFGKFRTTVVRQCGEVIENGRTYRLTLLKTSDDLYYYSLRLYNQQHKFIKQFLFEPWILNAIIDMLIQEANR